jgi:hypothetical protein|tara:strand:+ start:161 stop:382 length:222 start_codon:yes stop_codon:yes gene_type:complete
LVLVELQDLQVVHPQVTDQEVLVQYFQQLHQQVVEADQVILILHHLLTTLQHQEDLVVGLIMHVQWEQVILLQ